MQVVFLVMMGVAGAVMGSFLCCQVERMRRKEVGESKLGRWSVCMSCGKRLRWYENIPIVSWILLRGRCGKCHAKIGVAELVAEVVGLVAGVILATRLDVMSASGYEWGVWIVDVLFAVLLGYLAIYDGLYGELPGVVLTFLSICAIMEVILKQWSLFSVGSFGGIGAALGGAAVLGGIYLLLYIVSKGRLVGDGDWILAAAIGAALGSPWLALIALTLANLLACVVMGPVVIKRGKKNHMIYFGPWLAAGWLVTYTFADFLINLI